MPHVWRLLRINAKIGQEATPLSFSSKILSVSLGFEEVEEVGREDSSKDIILEMNSGKIDDNRKESIIEKLERLAEFCNEVKNSGI